MCCCPACAVLAGEPRVTLSPGTEQHQGDGRCNEGSPSATILVKRQDPLCRSVLPSLRFCLPTLLLNSVDFGISPDFLTLMRITWGISLRCPLRAPTLLGIYKCLKSLLVEISDITLVWETEVRLHSAYSSFFLHPPLPPRPSHPSFTPGQSLSKDFGPDCWPRRSCFPREMKHRGGFIHMSARTMKYYKRFRFISSDSLASFTVPIKALNDAIHQQADSIGSD